MFNGGRLTSQLGAGRLAGGGPAGGNTQDAWRRPKRTRHRRPTLETTCHGNRDARPLVLCRRFQRRCRSIVQRLVGGVCPGGWRPFLGGFAYRSFVPDRGSAERDRRFVRRVSARKSTRWDRGGAWLEPGWQPVPRDALARLLAPHPGRPTGF